MKQITTAADVLSRKTVINGISDIPGGVSLTIADLIGGNVLPQGTPLSAPTAGKRTVCKQAVLLAGSTTTVLKVTTGAHHFKVGNFACMKEGGKAYAIASIVTTGVIDAITVETAIDAVAEGAFVYEAAAESADASAFKNVPDVITKFAATVPTDSMVISMSDAYLRADIVEGVIGAAYLASLPGVLVVKY